MAWEEVTRRIRHCPDVFIEFFIKNKAVSGLQLGAILNLTYLNIDMLFLVIWKVYIII